MEFKRVLIKISGEMCGGISGSGLDKESIFNIALELKKAFETGVEIGIVIGAGNIMRGASTNFLSRVKADSAGMLGTAINSIALQDILEKELQIQSTVLGAFEIEGMFPQASPVLIKQEFFNKKIVIFAGGIGCPYFSTDTAGVLKALEIKADLLIKATKVDGVYDKDPMKFDDAKKFDTISYEEMLTQKLHVMDSTATSLAMENRLPIRVVNITSGTLVEILKGKSIGTLVS